MPKRTPRASRTRPTSLTKRASAKEPIKKVKEEKKVGKPHSPSALYSCLLKQWRVAEHLGDAPLVEAIGKILASSFFSSLETEADDPLPFMHLANSIGVNSRSHLCSLQCKGKESSPVSAETVDQLSNQLAGMSVKDDLPRNLTFDDHEKMMAALDDFPWTVCCIGTDMDGEHILLSRYEGGRGGEETGFLTRRVRMKEMRKEKMAPSFFQSKEGKEGKRTCVEEGQWGFGELMRTLREGTEITPKNPGKASKEVCFLSFSLFPFLMLFFFLSFPFLLLFSNPLLFFM